MYPDGQNVLIIDDDFGRRQAIERILTEEGFAVTAVSEGFAGLRAAGKRRFALIIAAVDLPGTLDGVSTVRRLRARQPRLKALFTGAFARWAQMEQPRLRRIHRRPVSPPRIARLRFRTVAARQSAGGRSGAPQPARPGFAQA
jgi:two-component system response regulator MprA